MNRNGFLITVLTCAVFMATVSVAKTTPPKMGTTSFWKTRKNQVAYINDMTELKGDKDYRVELATRGFELSKRLSLSKSREKIDNKYEKEMWDYFEVEYFVVDEVPTIDGEKKSIVPVYGLKEVEITFALLYDANEYNLSQFKTMKKDVKPYGLNEFNRYTVMSRTITYVGITADRYHYAAIAMPHMGYLYGNPILFSVQIKVDGVNQGDLQTRFKMPTASGSASGLITKDVMTKALLGPTATAGKPTADWLVWWEDQTITGGRLTVVNDDLIKDRSQTPFVVLSPEFYDMVK